DWHGEIEAGRDASRIILPVLTPAWKESEWGRYETYGGERTLGPDNPELAHVVYGLARSLHNDGRRDEAHARYQPAQALYERAPQTEPYNVPACIYHPGLAAYEQGRFDEAERLYLQALAVFEQVLAPHHPDLAIARESYETLLRARKTAAQSASNAPGTP